AYELSKQRFDFFGTVFRSGLRKTHSLMLFRRVFEHCHERPVRIHHSSTDINYRDADWSRFEKCFETIFTCPECLFGLPARRNLRSNCFKLLEKLTGRNVVGTFSKAAMAKGKRMLFQSTVTNNRSRRLDSIVHAQNDAREVSGCGGNFGFEREQVFIIR